MGWAFGIIDGREVGYSVDATCDREGCEEEIDRGLSYVCGHSHGSDGGCGGYFCPKHLVVGIGPCQMCDECYAEWERENPEDEETP
jgi:hypothetical protein